MQSLIKKVVWVCLTIVPFIALHVADSGLLDVLSWGSSSGLFFPFISGKNLIFRFLVEIAFAGWAVLALYDSSYRIKISKSPIMIAYGLFTVSIEKRVCGVILNEWKDLLGTSISSHTSLCLQ